MTAEERSGLPRAPRRGRLARGCVARSFATRRPRSSCSSAVLVALGGGRRRAANLQQFILPRPVRDRGGVRRGVAGPPDVPHGNTLYEALGGLVIGVTAGVLTAFAVSRWARVREAILPIAIGASADPDHRRRADHVATGSAS